ncbi:Uncharacterised protein [Campylobacter hyointestinalis subsp. hyointestinalis]|uniref:WG repeat-containing protein n=1 Tax=Campylobacter hyointestinalis subsp. hyointestinalis TaxID=91352 RepID=A0A0S4RA25_CAMHY|nr:hypothetical protein [Campylobacter hyointestinalis]CUU70972.1 Uncharacterised protein [Campylobacter hyointestinalis subsp. hyointestinalis]
MSLINKKMFDCADKLIRGKIENALNANEVVGMLKDKSQRFLENDGIPYNILYGFSAEKQVYINDEYEVKQKDGLAYKYLVYTIGLIDGKVKPIGYYVDGDNNIRTRAIKMEALEHLIEALGNVRIKSTGEIKFMPWLEQIKESFESINNSFTTEYVKVSEGYDMPDLPSSCQKGHGERFEFMDILARMLLLRDKNGKIQARAYVWNKGLVKRYKNGEYETIDKPCCDLIYAENSTYRDILLSYLESNDIFNLWGQCNVYPFIDGALGDGIGYYKIELPTANKEMLLDAIEYNNAPWLDCFNHFKSDTGELFSYDWKHFGYSDNDLDFSIVDNDFILLKTGGECYREGELNTEYDEYYGERIDADAAVEVTLGDWTGITHEDNAVWSDYHGGYILSENSVWVDGDEDYTYSGSGVRLVEIDDKAYFFEMLDVYCA